MDFLPVEPEQASYSLLVHPGDLYILLHEARYAYKHGIAYRAIDHYFEEDGSRKELHRGTRLSITLRRMLPGGHILTEAGAAVVDRRE
jgi:alkylated DNA repair dioxygenase AlkB